MPRPAARVRRQPHHWGLIASFLVLVLLPTLISGGYLVFRAADQYGATVGFAVRTEKSSTMIDLLGGISQLSGASSTDAGMVYQYLQSPELVKKLDSRLNLRAIFARAYATDPVFAYDPSGRIEDLVDFWNRMVTVSFDQGTGLLTLDVRAFSAADAQAVAQAAFDESSHMINDLSDIAQNDAMRSARTELTQAEDRLRAARAALQGFRDRTNILDPSADVTGQMGLLNSLQDQLVAAMIDLDLLHKTTQGNDARANEAQRKIDVIRNRIAEARQAFGSSADRAGDQSYASLIGEFERLSVDQDFAEKAYVAALGALDAAQAAARQQSLYLAAYQNPMLAEASEYPRRGLLTGLVALFCFLGWAVLALIYYSLRDRR
ncbi:MAG: sugar transporter [Rhodobacteraceae bacterium]|nr:sugar transporter [Paracoccaceae bacterium]